MKFKKVLYIILGCLFLPSIFAQTKYQGKVVDEKKLPVPFANVVLISNQDSSFIAGTTTGEDGTYSLESSFYPDCSLRFSAIGYRTIYTESIEEIIILPEASYGLDEVAILGSRPVYRMKGTGFITEVNNSLLKNIGTANDVLKQLPGITGSDGSFEVFGKGTATIYINNRQVRDKTELERLSSEDIVLIELINNPGTDYDVDVRAVLKIKTKRKTEGFASRLRLRGTQNHYFSDLEQLNLSYATERFNWYSHLYHNSPHNQIDGRNNVNIHIDEVNYNLVSRMMDWEQNAHFATLETGAGFYLNSKQEIGTSYTYEYSKDTYRGEDIETLLFDGTLMNELSNYYSSNNKYNQHAINLYYTGTIGEKTGIKLNADYIHRDADNRGIVSESGWNDERTISSLNSSIYNLYASQLIIDQPIGASSLKGGVDFSYMDYDQVYLNVENYLPNGLFSSEETKIAGFVNYSAQFGKLNWQAGIRYEHFRARYYENNLEEPTVSRTYKEFYPNISLSLPVDKVNLSLSYSKRTARPSFYQLRNGIEYSNQYIYSQGNPYLRFSQIHDLSLNAGYRFFSLSLGYSYTKDRMVMSDNILNGEPVTLVLSHKNISRYQDINSMLTFQHKIGLWSPTWTAAVFKSHLNYYNKKGDKINLGRPYGYFAINNMFTLPKEIILNVDATNMTAGNNGEVYMKPTASLDLGIRKTLLKGALDLNLQLQDVFGSSKRRMTIYTEHTTYYRWNYNDSRMLRLSIVYNFNTYKKRYKGSSSVQSEIWRM